MKTRKWLPLLALSVGFFFAASQSAFAQSANLFNQLVEASKGEVAKKGGKVTIANNWTPKQAKLILAAFKNDFPFVTEPRFERIRTVETMQQMLMEYKAARPPAIDVTSVSDELWPAYHSAGAFVKAPFPYQELAKSLPKDWPALDPRLIDMEGYFLSTSGATRGIAYNKNLVPPDKAPKSWEDCLNPMWRGKSVYDPRSKLSAFQHDPKTREWFLKWLRALADNKIVLNRGVQENLEKVAAGEFPLYCGTNYSNAMPMVDEGAPIDFILPDPFPIDLGVQVFITKWSLPATSQLFAVWTATKAQPIMDAKGYRGFPWIPGTRIHGMAKGKYVAICGPDCLRKVSEVYDPEHARILKLPGAK
jgi:iron(III) transport system substrate-binding protein